MIVLSLWINAVSYVRLSPLDTVSNFQVRRTKGQKRENPFFCPRINQCKSCVIGGNPVFIKSFSYLKWYYFMMNFTAAQLFFSRWCTNSIPRLSAFRG